MKKSYAKYEKKEHTMRKDKETEKEMKMEMKGVKKRKKC